jgi:hypothetical protein
VNFKQRRDKAHRAVMRVRYAARVERFVDRVMVHAYAFVKKTLSRPVMPQLVVPPGFFGARPTGSTIDVPLSYSATPTGD